MATLQASSVNGNLTKYGNNIYAGGRLLTFNVAQATQTNQYHRIAKFQASDASNSSQGSGGYLQNVLLRICANPDGNQSNRGNVALVSISSAHWGGPASVVVLNNFVYGLGLITKVRVSKQNASPYEWWVDIYVTNQISAKTDYFIVEAIEGAITLGFTANVSAGTDTTEVDLSESGFYPSKITNTTLITNLNADYLDGQHGSYYLNAANLTGTISGDRGVTAGSSSVSFVEYNGTTATAGQFDGGSTAPSGTTRLNYGGYLYASRLYAPIFYDTDNTNYYLDPSNTGTSLIVAGNLSEGGYVAYPERVYTINLSAQSTSNFYPIVLDASPGEGANGVWHHRFSVEMPSQSGAVNFNNHTLVAEVRGQGWSDQQLFYRAFHTFYDTAERSILGIWRGTQSWYGVVVYVRGGMTYYVRSNSRSVAAYTSAVTLNSSATFAIKNASNTDVSGTSANISEMLNLINANAGFYYSNIVYATNFSGSGSLLTSLNATQLTSGTLPGDRGVTAGSTSSSFVEYNGTTATGGQFDGGTTAPSGTTRLNYGGYLYATRFYGDGSNLTSLAAGNLSGTIPSAVLANSSFYLGTTQIALNRASANLALTGITSIDGNAATVTGITNQNSSNTDLNTLTTSGFYRLGSGATNDPTPNKYGQLLVIRGAGDTITQIIGDYATGILYTRSGNPSNVGGSGSYSSWRTILDSANYSSYALPLTGGTVTGITTFSNISDYQITLNGGGTTWAGINWIDVNGSDQIYFNGQNKTFSIGGGGSNVSGKKLHIDGGVTIGAGYDSNSMPTNGLSVEGGIQQNGGKYVKDFPDYQWVSGSSNYYVDHNAGWYKVAQITVTSNCTGAVLYGRLYDRAYHDCEIYDISVVIRAECDFTTNNESHFVEIGCTVVASSDQTNYKNKIRAILVASSTNSRTYELQFYETPWNSDYWELFTSGWTIYSTGQAPGTATGTARVNYQSKMNADVIYANDSHRAPIFYDSDNTNYYLNPASTSVVNELTNSGIGTSNYNLMKYGGTRSGDWQSFTNLTGQLNIVQVENISGGSHTNYPTGVYGYGGLMSWRLANHSFQLYAAHTGALAYKTQWNNDNYSDWRRILDSTNYPHAANMNQNVRSTDSPTFADIFATGNVQIRNAAPTITLRDTDHRTGYIHVNSNIFYVLTGAADSAYANWGQVANSRWPLEINLSNNNATFGGDVNAISLTAPIFYDANDTNYYLNPAGASVLNGLKFSPSGNNVSGDDAIISIVKPDDADWAIQVSGNREYGIEMRMATAHSYAYRALKNGTEYFRIGSDYLYHDTSIRAPIFYDTDDTNYYLNPASTSVLNGITINGDSSLSGKTSFGNRYQTYSYFHGGAQDLAWKKIADITFDTSLYSAVTFKVEVIDANTNWGGSADCKPMTFFVTCKRSGGVLNDNNDAIVYGPVADYVRAVKTATGVYELQIRQVTDWRHHIFMVEIVSKGSGTVTYVTGVPANGSTTGTNYLPTTAGWTQNLPNLSVSNLSTLGIIKANSGANYPHSFTNTDSGNTHWTNRNDRLLTSNGTNWATDGRDPIMALVTSGNSNATTIANSIGLTLHNESQTNNTFSPAITFSNRSNSGNYNTVYAAIIGKKTGQGIDSNWSAGELHFYTMPVGAYENDVPSLLINSAGSIGIGTTSPATLLQIGTGTPTAATSGIQFGDDTGTRIYRDVSNRIRTSGNITSGGYLQTTNNQIYPNSFSNTLNINVGNTAQDAWIAGIELSPGGNVRIPGGIVNSGLSAQWSLSGGGTATFKIVSTVGYIKWTSRVIAIPVEKTEFSSNGYIEINCPASGTVTYYGYSGGDVTTTYTCTSDGIPLGTWDALYYEVTPGQTYVSDQTKFRVVNYQNSTWRPSSNWLLIAIRNGDHTNQIVRWIPGQANIFQGGSYDFSRLTEYFYANNYYLNGATSTYLRSDNAFNFLTNAGGAQNGKFNGIQVSSDYSGTLVNDGILFGTDSNLYRTSANTLKTDDSLIINSKCSVATSISATYTVDINGSLHYTSASASSDARFKKNIEPINDALIKLNNVRGVKFEWNEFVNARRNGYVLNKPTLGVIAQELEAVFPELVDHWHLSDDCPDARAVNYEKIIPVLIEAVKELNNKNIQLEARLSALESKLQ